MIDRLKDLLHFIYDVKGLIQWGGLSLVCAIVFTETGLFMGFFLPGDSLLVTAGIFAKAGYVSLAWLLVLASLCAVAGDQVGYAIGYKTGEALYQRPDSLFFKKKHLQRTHDFYEKYGSKTIVIARFVPIVRTFAPVVAGIGQMDYKRFVSYNVVGGLAWVWGMVLVGYSLASAVPNIDKSIHKVILVVIFLSILPGVIEFWRERRRARG
ncbi:MAG: VTT domain-containing protein [Elusimicrobia bacterium]|nr:VTT domain-containing protein [Elusimicrobiota bacterium]